MAFASTRILYMVLGALCLFFPLYSWKRLFRQLQRMRETRLFYQRHNCCVTYFKGKGFAGWPPYKNRVGFNTLDSTKNYEPILYFLRTTKYSISIAVMILNVIAIEETLCSLANRGVHVRLLLDYDTSDVKIVQRLKRSGVHVKIFVNTSETTECLMHHKYAVKDCNGKSGFLLFGSLNWTNSGFTNNYEDIVFTTNFEAVKSFSDNFENLWKHVNDLEEYDVTTQAILFNKIKVLN